MPKAVRPRCVRISSQVFGERENLETALSDVVRHELAHAITAERSPVRFVATLRADHFDAPLRHPAMAELVNAGTVTVRVPSPGTPRSEVSA